MEMFQGGTTVVAVHTKQYIILGNDRVGDAQLLCVMLGLFMA